MERIIGNEHCCAVSQPTAPDFCLHMSLFYRRCDRAATTPPPRTSSAASPAPARALPPPTREPRMGRYAVYRLIYETRPPAAAAAASLPRPGSPPPLHRLYVETGLVGPVRGLYLDVIGSPDTGLRYSEMPGDDPEPAAAAAVAATASFAPAAPGATSSSSQSAPGPVHALQTKTLIGTIAADDFDRFRNICRCSPSHPPQFDGRRRPVSWVPVRRSRDWVQESIARSIAEGILDVGLRQ